MRPSQNSGVTLRRAGPVVSYADPGGLEGLCWGTARPMSGLQENTTLTAAGDTGLGQCRSTPVGDSHAWHGVLLAWISIGTCNSPGTLAVSPPTCELGTGVRVQGPPLLQGWFQSTVGLDVGHLWPNRVPVFCSSLAFCSALTDTQTGPRLGLYSWLVCPYCWPHAP